MLRWAVKGRFTAPAVNAQTQAGTTNFQNSTVTGSFVFRDADDVQLLRLDINRSDDIFKDMDEAVWEEAVEAVCEAWFSVETLEEPDSIDVAAIVVGLSV
jgi:hypothetical protein